MSRRGLLWIVAAIAATIFAVSQAGLQVRRVASESMADAARADDWIVVRELDESGDRDVEHGDIVVFRFPLGTSGRAIKRVVALDGDVVEYTSADISVNGVVTPIAGAPDGSSAGPNRLTVPADHVFLVGDNSKFSSDSRAFGPVPDEEIVGSVLVVISPWEAAGLVALIALIAVAVLLLANRARDPEQRSDSALG